MRTYDQQRLWQRARFAMNRLGVRVAERGAYWNFVQQADRVKRQTFEPGTCHEGTKTRGSRVVPRLVPYEAKLHAWRALAAKYEKDGLDPATLAGLLADLWGVRFDPPAAERRSGRAGPG